MYCVIFIDHMLYIVLYVSGMHDMYKAEIFQRHLMKIIPEMRRAH